MEYQVVAATHVTLHEYNITMKQLSHISLPLTIIQQQMSEQNGENAISGHTDEYGGGVDGD